MFLMLSVVLSKNPIALHQLVVIEPATDMLIRLKIFDTSGKTFNFNISSLPESGSLYQLSQVFSSYGYMPVAGAAISSAGTIVSGSNNRVYYTRPHVDAAGESIWGKFTFNVKADNLMSYDGTVTLVPSSGYLVSSSFLLGSDDWTILGNKAPISPAKFESLSRGGLNNYIYSTDDKVNLGVGGIDSSLWYFVAPSKFLGNIGISYGGNLQFTMGAFSGDFSKLNGLDTSLVELECEQCVGPIRKGIKLVFPIRASSTGRSFTGISSKFTISLTEGAGWLRDPQNSLQKWTAPTKCEVIQVLSRLSSFRILGDWTSWHESVALDDVRFVNLKEQIPICAQVRPDASECNCK